MTLSYEPPHVSRPLTLKKTLYKPQLTLPGTDCPLRSGAPLAGLTSFRVGGPAEWYVAPRRLEDLQASFEWAKEQGLPLTLLGAGSNMLVSDRGLPGLVICTRHLRQTQFDPIQEESQQGQVNRLPVWHGRQQNAVGKGWNGQSESLVRLAVQW
jgi:UDP-N-acetylmuramate dehydrogenase